MPTDSFSTRQETNRPDDLRRLRRPAQPPAAQPRTAGPQPGEWLWLCRPGAEDDVCDELQLQKWVGRTLQPGLVAAQPDPNRKRKSKSNVKLPADLIFARQGMPAQVTLSWRSPGDASGPSPAPADIAERLVTQLSPYLKSRPMAVHVFAPDNEAGKMLMPLCDRLQEVLAATLARLGHNVVTDGTTAQAEGGQLVMMCLLSPHEAVAGAVLTSQAASLFPGGVQRVRRPGGSPSRSAHKLAEALAWLGHGPQSGESCVDLGAAPGGWSLVLADRRCQVISVDLGALTPGVAARVHHVRANAFNFFPDEPVDWLCCDMAYRPLEVAGLLARWGRRRWARFVIANFKLPMKKRVDMLLRVREILESGGWTGFRIRQLYHDREEVTLFAWRGFGLDARPPGHRSRATAAAGSARSPDRDAAPDRDDKPRGAPPSPRKARPAPAKPGVQRRPEPRSEGRPGARSDARPSTKPKARSGNRSEGRPSARSDSRPASRSVGRPGQNAGPARSSSGRPQRPGRGTAPARGGQGGPGRSNGRDRGSSGPRRPGKR